MKKRMAVLSAFMIGVNCLASGAVVMAEQNEGKTVGLDHSDGSYIPEDFFCDTENDFVKESLELFKLGGKEILSPTPDLFDLRKEESQENEEDKKILEEFLDNKNEDEETELESKSTDENLAEDTEKEETKEQEVQKWSGLENLQIPQKLEVVLDPWELERKGQIYSGEYVIQNTGDTVGVLTLSHLACKPQGQSGVVVKTDKIGLHGDEKKSVYMEMVFGNGERMVLSEESSQYQVKLQAGEKLSLSFTGEMNEYASQGWENGDVRVEVVYTWDVVKTQTGGNMDEMGADAKHVDVQEEEVLSDNMESDEPVVSENGIGSDENLIEEEQETDEEDISQIDGDNQELEGGKQAGEEEPKIIDLREFQTSEAVIDSWRVEEGQILSKQYIVRNTGENTGTFTLSNFVCRAAEESGILVNSEKKEMDETEERAVYMEMVLGNGERVVLSQEKAVYKIDLKPEEEISVYFVGKMNGDGIKSMEEGELVVSALCSWDEKEMGEEQSPGVDNGLTD